MQKDEPIFPVPRKRAGVEKAHHSKENHTAKGKEVRVVQRGTLPLRWRSISPDVLSGVLEHLRYRPWNVSRLPAPVLP